jgi:hypothetical protein
MILNYLLSLCIFILSAGSLAELFIHSSLKNTKQHSDFIKTTKEKIKDKGFGTLMGITFLLLFSSFFYFYLLLSTTQNKEIKNRKDIYLCAKKYINSTNSYINAISKLNIAFDALNLASATGLATAEAEATRKALKLAQAGIHVSYLKKIQSSPYCSIENKTLFMLNLPYETSKVVLLNTTLDGKTKLRKDTWNLKISKIENGIRIKHLFYLELKVELESIYQSTIKTTIAEKEIVDSLNLKPLFGSLP